MEYVRFQRPISHFPTLERGAASEFDRLNSRYVLDVYMFMNLAKGLGFQFCIFQFPIFQLPKIEFQ